MASSNSPLAPETQAVAQAYAALNRNDVAAFVKDFDPQVERIEPADFPGNGIYLGVEAVMAHVRHHRGNWAEGSCAPQRFIAAGDKVVALVDVNVRLQHETEWRQGRVVDVFTFRNGKVVQFRTFFDQQQGLQWAGVDASEAT
ncbi:MAG: nuclear transport factor 2 family protein [Planctomycetes bacterium]|nr:nuclear transport factor 2 family protein [Planctomycetota bacterium]